MKAKWNGKIIAESNKTIDVDGIQYFPRESVNKKFLVNSKKTTVCNWKGTASYYNIVVDDKTNKDAAWYYPEPSAMANNVKGYIAFWNGVDVFN